MNDTRTSTRSIPSRTSSRLVLPGLAAAALFGVVACRSEQPASAQERRAVLTGQAALGDWTTDAPGVRRRITTAELPPPNATPSVDRGPTMVKRPSGAWPQVPPGFKVQEVATGLTNPRHIATAPNGDLFIAESSANRIRIIRDADNDGKPEVNQIFAEGLTMPFGIAFYPLGARPEYVYVGNTDSVVRIPYQVGDTHATAKGETVVANIPGGGRLRGGGHWTRTLTFSNDGKKLYVSVGSLTNAEDVPREKRRANILEFNPDGTDEKIYAWGIRNAVGLVTHPTSGQLWVSVNERDQIGDDLVPDYITHVEPGGFYGFPWYYIGPNQDPRHPGKRPELRDKVIVPDVLLQSHSASLGMCFYTARQFPREFRGEAFAAEHGSWNRSKRTGYKVIRVPMRGSRATGEYEDFMTGFVTPEGNVWGRPVGVTVGKDGSLFVTDDGSNTLWKVSYTGDK